MQQLNRPFRQAASASLVALLLLTACSGANPDWPARLDDLSARFERSIGLSATAGFETAPGAPHPIRSLADIEAARLSRLQVFNELQSIDPAALPPGESHKYFTLYDQLAPLVELDRFAMGGDETPGPYHLTDRHGAHVTLIRELTVRPIPSRQAADEWLSSLADIAVAIDLETQRFGVETASGVVPPRTIIERAVADLNAQLNPNREPAILAHFRSELARQTSIPEFESARLADEARTIYASDVAPRLTSLRNLFTSLEPKAPTEPGLWAQPNGAERYAALFAFFTAPNIAPDDIATLAETAIEDARIEADTLLAGLEMTDGTVGARLATLRMPLPEELTDDENDEPVNPDVAMGARITQRFDWARNNLAQMISAGAIRPLAVRSRALQPHDPPWPVRLHSQLDPAASDVVRYDAAAFAQWPDWSLPVLTYAEALPGRHLIASQRSFAHPMHDGAGLGLANGWSLYAAGLASNLGGYDDRVHDRLGYLQFVILQAALAAADIGVHTEKWSREDAVSFLRDATGLPADILGGMVEELIRRPAQSAAAFSGAEAIVNFRDRTDHQLGPAFDLRRFHDRILAGGPRPIATVERDIEQFIAEATAPPPAT